MKWDDREDDWNEYLTEMGSFGLNGGAIKFGFKRLNFANYSSSRDKLNPYEF